MKAIVESYNAPKAIGAYSQACHVEKQVFLSGQIGLDPKTGDLVCESTKGQLEQAVKNLAAVCTAANTSLKNVVKLNIFLKSMSDYPVINDIIDEYFAPLLPARTVIGVSGLPKDAKVEIDAIAFLD